MSTARPISDLYNEFSEEELQTLHKEQELLLMEYDLISELRKDRDLTQKELAEIMEIRQSAISKIENQEDVLVQTLERYIKALGGQLEITATFPGKRVVLNQFTRPTATEEARAR